LYLANIFSICVRLLIFLKNLFKGLDFKNDPTAVNKFLGRYLKKLYLSSRVGFVLSVSDGVVRACGLKFGALGGLVVFPKAKVRGIICNLNKKTVDILLLGDDRNVKSGMSAFATKHSLRVPVTRKLIGRVLNGLGQVIDGGPKITGIKYTANINVKAPGIIFRQKVSEPLFTGVKVIDSLIPVGRGQRELIIGDKGTGKTSICLDAILNQKKENGLTESDKVYCIYVSIGQKRSGVKSIHELLKKFGADKHTIIVSASASDSAAVQYLAPYSACAIAEYFMSFAHSLIVYDDLNQHAAAYRQISLLLRRPPGREAYPGDVFYLHSRLLERAAKLHDDYGGGSVTALPVIETLFGDVTAYIPTNVISITDGQIFLDRGLFTEGILPAVNIGLSVSRVGSAAQLLAMKSVAGTLKLELAQYREVKDFIKFGSDLNEDTLRLIRRGQLLTTLLTQPRFAPVGPEEQIITLYAGLKGFMDKVAPNKEKEFIAGLIKFVKESNMFRSHFYLLRDDNTFKRSGLEALSLMLNYYTKYIYKC
jgi:F-type H+-transporting ATPase subunit alpha